MTRTIDAEVRLLPDDWCNAGFDVSDEQIVADKIYGHPLTGMALPKASLTALGEEMVRSGVERCIVRGLFWRDPERIKQQNAYLAEVAQANPDRFYPMAVLPSPYDVDPVEVVRSLRDEMGFRMFEMIPSWHGYKMDDGAAEPALAEAERSGMIVGVEVDHMIRDPRSVDTAYSALSVMRRHPDLRMLVAHLGGLLCLYGHNSDVVGDLSNAYFVTSVPKTPQWIKYAVESIGPQRVIFGTDYPFNIGSNQTDLRDAIREIGLSDEDEAAVLGGNLGELLEVIAN